MRVPVMDIGKVRVGMRQLGVMMDVRVRLTRWITWLVRMLMVLVVTVKMFVGQRLMMVQVNVAFGKM
jgi:hypothetical protein